MKLSINDLSKIKNDVKQEDNSLAKRKIQQYINDKLQKSADDIPETLISSVESTDISFPRDMQIKFSKVQWGDLFFYRQDIGTKTHFYCKVVPNNTFSEYKEYHRKLSKLGIKDQKQYIDYRYNKAPIKEILAGVFAVLLSALWSYICFACGTQDLAKVLGWVFRIVCVIFTFYTLSNLLKWIKIVTIHNLKNPYQEAGIDTNSWKWNETVEDWGN